MSVIRAETLITGAFVEHNLAVAFVNHFGYFKLRLSSDSSIF